MRTKDDIEAFLRQSRIPFEEVGDGMWVVRDTYNSLDNLVITISGPILLFRLKVLDVGGAGGNNESLFRTLLELNAQEMVHGAYGIEDDAIVLTEACELENLDHNELQAVIDDFSLAMSKHHDTIASFRRPSVPA